MKGLFPNLDFEYELMFGERRLSKPVRAQIDRWSHIMRLVSGWQEATVNADPVDFTQVLPWGVTPTVVQTFPHLIFPDPALVKQVNSKVYSARWEAESNLALPGACLVSTMDQLEVAIAHSPRLLVKHPFGVAGRERIEVRNNLEEAQRAWVEKALLTTPLICEPWVDIEREYSVQFQLDQSVEFLGWSTLVADQRGQHRGHQRATSPLPAMILEPAQSAAQSVFDLGYKGPLGIDAFTGCLAGEQVLRPVSEINARMTFGRLALHLFDHVDSQNHVMWWHPSKRRRGQAGSPLPVFCDPNGKSDSVLVSKEELDGLFVD